MLLIIFQFVLCHRVIFPSTKVSIVLPYNCVSLVFKLSINYYMSMVKDKTRTQDVVKFERVRKNILQSPRNAKTNFIIIYSI